MTPRPITRLVLRFTRLDRVPLALRRQVARAFTPLAGEEFALEIDGVTYRGRLDNYLEWMVWVTGRYYESTYIELIRSLGLGGLALDVGGNVGNHALAFSTMFDEVIAFEPYEPLFRRLEAKVADRGNVQVHNLGLGTRPASVPFAPPSGSNLGTGRVAADGRHIVAIEPGDRFLAQASPGRVRFIKVDVEGHEADVLEGLAGTLREDRPVVFYEAFRTAGRPRAEALASSFALFPDDYVFWGLRGQTTFPVQRRVARPARITPRTMGRRYAYVLACPAEVARTAGLL
jgi:FkbM family methyltransferase